MQYSIKNVPKITLLYLLRRRKIAFSDFILNRGIGSYDELVSLCHGMGCSAPDEQTYAKNVPTKKIEKTEVVTTKKKRKIDPEEKEINEPTNE